MKRTTSGRAIRRSRFAKQYDVAFWIVAHPDEAGNGSKRFRPRRHQRVGNWANKADYGLTYHRPNFDENQDCGGDIISPGKGGGECGIRLPIALSRMQHDLFTNPVPVKATAKPLGYIAGERVEQLRN